MKIKPIGPNQTELHTNKGTFFFSYETLVAACLGGEFFRTTENYSKTTSKHINQWLAGRSAKPATPEWLKKQANYAQAETEVV